jgi:hypothetical protein
MLLSLVGIQTTRAEALGLFGLSRSNPSYAGASHNDIGAAFTGESRIRSWRWEYHKRFNFASVSKCLRSQLHRNNHPTLLSFGAIHKNGDWRCLHVVVAIRVTEESIEVLDPLGLPPAGSTGNVWFERGDWPTPVRVLGNSYSVDPARVTSVLRWTAN